MDGEWCSWLAGLFDGEATFVIEPNGTPRLRITLTESDVGVLRHIQESLGFGSLYKTSNQRDRDKGKNSKDCFVYCASGRKNCSVLVRLLTGRMKSKKAQEFDVWAAAVAESIAMNPNGNHPGRRAAMLPYREELLRLRRR